jgi:uncharacterized protein YhdP
MTNKSEKSLLSASWAWFSMTCMHCARMTWYLGVVLFVVAAVAITVFRFWLPALVDRKAEVENFLTNQIGHAVVIEELSAQWQGLYPSLHASKLVLKNAEGKQDAHLSLGELKLPRVSKMLI